MNLEAMPSERDQCHTTEPMHPRAHALQLEGSPHATVKIPCAETKTQHSQK